MILQIVRYGIASIAWACAIAAVAAPAMAGLEHSLGISEVRDETYTRWLIFVFASLTLIAILMPVRIKAGEYRVSTEVYVIGGIFAAFVAALSIAIMLLNRDQQYASVFVASALLLGFALQSTMIAIWRNAWRVITVSRQRKLAQ